MGRIIAVCNQKGGTGKTTTAINIATYLAMAGKQVLLLDLDPQANATSGLGINKHDIKRSTYHILLEETGLAEVIMPTVIKNLALAPANVDLTGAEVELVGALGREYRLKNILVQEKDKYEFMIIDSPPSLGLLTINGLCAANTVLIPVQCEYYALEGLTQLMNTVSLVRKHLNPELDIEGVLMTMADFRTNLTKEVIEEARKFFKDKVFNSVIPRNVRLTEAPSYGKPIAIYDKDSIGAAKYEELTREILQGPAAKPVVENLDQKSGEA